MAEEEEKYVRRLLLLELSNLACVFHAERNLRSFWSGYGMSSVLESLPLCVSVGAVSVPKVTSAAPRVKPLLTYQGHIDSRVWIL